MKLDHYNSHLLKQRHRKREAYMPLRPPHRRNGWLVVDAYKQDGEKLAGNTLQNREYAGIACNSLLK